MAKMTPEILLVSFVLRSGISEESDLSKVRPFIRIKLIYHIA